MRAHASLRLGPLRGTTPELLASPWYGAWGFCVVWEAGLPHKTSSPPTQRRNGRACSSLTARGGGLPVGVIPYISSYPCVTNLMLWGHILSVAPETSSMEGGDRFHRDTSHDRPDPFVARCDHAAPRGV